MGLIKKPAILFFLVCGILAGLLAGAFSSLIHDLPEINQLKQFKPPSVTTVYSADNRILTRIFLEKRFPVSIESVPEHLIDALIVTEDRLFFSHSGINVKAIARAVIHDIKAGGFEQGASTLTQQLAKTLFLTPEKSIVRKIREALLAVQIERRYTKEDILELYLNLIYLGSGAYGVEAAAQTYFNCSVDELTLDQSALIAGLPKAPSYYTPKSYPDRARKRRKIVLRQMLSQKTITLSEYEKANQAPVYLPSHTAPNLAAPYFVDYLKKILADQSGREKGFSNGLSIHTTLDLGLQQQAESAVAKHIAGLDTRMAKNNFKDPFPQAALVALDVKTGAIRSMVGGRNFDESQFNRAAQARRQPGSAFKPLVYAAALLKGYDQDQTLVDAPLHYGQAKGKTWKIKNFSRTYKGETTLRKALALSLNTPVVRLMEDIGPEHVIDLASRAGISSPLTPYLSLALGTSEVTLLELTSSYIPFANKGVQVTPFAIDRIADSEGRIIFQNIPIKKTIMPRIEAAIMADMLKAAIHEGTGRKAAHIKKDIAGKTGTTDKYKDALFIGFSPDLVCGVWVGNDDASPLGPYETGARAALPIWIDYMENFLARRPFQYFDIPDGTKMVYIHPDSGRIISGEANQKPPRKIPSVRALIKTKDSK